MQKKAFDGEGSRRRRRSTSLEAKPQIEADASQRKWREDMRRAEAGYDQSADWHKAMEQRRMFAEVLGSQEAAELLIDLHNCLGHREAVRTVGIPSRKITEFKRDGKRAVRLHLIAVGIHERLAFDGNVIIDPATNDLPAPPGREAWAIPVSLLEHRSIKLPAVIEIKRFVEAHADDLAIPWQEKQCRKQADADRYCSLHIGARRTGRGYIVFLCEVVFDDCDKALALARREGQKEIFFFATKEWKKVPKDERRPAA